MCYVIVDSHCDTISKIMHKKDSLYKNNYQVDLVKLQNFVNPIQFFSIWLHPKYYRNPFIETIKAIDYFYEEIKKNDSVIGYAGSIKDIEKNMSQNKISAFLTIEGGEALEGEIEVLRALYKLGVRSMTLTWNYQNQIGHGVMENGIEEGLTDFGMEVIQEMNILGMIIDVSHLSESGFWDIKRIASKPFIASHSNARTICNHPRNLSDSQLKAIAEVDGVVGINAYPPFLHSSGSATIDDFIAHINYIVKLIGINYVGFGCDFDGMHIFTKGVEDVSKLDAVCKYLEKKYGSNAEKIMYKNFIRVMKEVLIE